MTFLGKLHAVQHFELLISNSVTPPALIFHRLTALPCLHTEKGVAFTQKWGTGYCDVSLHWT
jgi:hypothetical protein